MLRWATVSIGALILLLSSGCVPHDAESCSSSKALADGATTKVEVQVRSKVGVSMIGLIDVNGGLYGTPDGEVRGVRGNVTDLADGDYSGTVVRHGEQLTLHVEDETLPLSGPESCD
jgi:hypothetical protein